MHIYQDDWWGEGDLQSPVPGRATRSSKPKPSLTPGSITTTMNARTSRSEG